MAPTEVERLATIEQKLDDVKETVACLPILCEQQARHDERISALEQKAATIGVRAWLIITGVVVGASLSVISFFKDFFQSALSGR